jgi:hypothetical protein
MDPFNAGLAVGTACDPSISAVSAGPGRVSAVSSNEAGVVVADASNGSTDVIQRLTSDGSPVDLTPGQATPGVSPVLAHDRDSVTFIAVDGTPAAPFRIHVRRSPYDTDSVLYATAHPLYHVAVRGNDVAVALGTAALNPGSRPGNPGAAEVRLLVRGRLGAPVVTLASPVTGMAWGKFQGHPVLAISQEQGAGLLVYLLPGNRSALPEHAIVDAFDASGMNLLIHDQESLSVLGSDGTVRLRTKLRTPVYGASWINPSQAGAMASSTGR